MLALADHVISRFPSKERPRMCTIYSLPVSRRTSVYPQRRT